MFLSFEPQTEQHASNSKYHNSFELDGSGNGLSVNGMSGPKLHKRITDMIPSEMDTSDLEDYFECDKIFGNANIRPILSASEWMTMRRTYHEMVGPNKSSIAPLSATEDGFHVPIEVKEAPGKGRGVFATTNIKQGTLVHNATRQSALFHNGISFRRYLALLPNNLACEVLQLHFAFHFIDGDDDEDDDDDDEDSGDHYYTIAVELDANGLVNEPNRHSKGNRANRANNNQPNIDCDPELAKDFGGGCDVLDFATRDIAAGEELICFYGDLEDADKHKLW
jgi:hypothetical protein